MFGTGDELDRRYDLWCEIGEKAIKEFRLLEYSEIALLAEGQVIATTMPGRDLNEQCRHCQ